MAADRVVLTPPSVRTSDTDAKLEMSAADESQSLPAFGRSGPVRQWFHVGQADGRQVGQIKLGDRWLVVKLPVDTQHWNDGLPLQSHGLPDRQLFGTRQRWRTR